jgi:hypothetical protein
MARPISKEKFLARKAGAWGREPAWEWLAYLRQCQRKPESAQSRARRHKANLERIRAYNAAHLKTEEAWRQFEQEIVAELFD